MTEPIALYQVSYSERVRQRRKALAAEATQRGDGSQFAAALKEFHRRLCIYPEFGDPYLDLASERAQMCRGIIRPMAMRYAIYEDRRLVIVATLPVLLLMRGQEPSAEG